MKILICAAGSHDARLVANAVFASMASEAAELVALTREEDFTDPRKGLALVTRGVMEDARPKGPSGSVRRVRPRPHDHHRHLVRAGRAPSFPLYDHGGDAPVAFTIKQNCDRWAAQMTGVDGIGAACDAVLRLRLGG